MSQAAGKMGLDWRRTVSIHLAGAADGKEVLTARALIGAKLAAGALWGD
jgi:hypothetical protein